MHCVHIRYLRSIPIIIRASLPSVQLELLEIYAVPPASPNPLKVIPQALALLACELLFSCRLSFASALDARLLASKSIPCRLPSCSQPFFSSFALCPSPATAPLFLAFPFFLPLRSLFFSPLIPAFQTSAYLTKNPSNSSACTTVLILSLSFFLSFDLPFVARIRTGRECGGCRSGKGDEGGKGMSVASGGSSGGDT